MPVPSEEYDSYFSLLDTSILERKSSSEHPKQTNYKHTSQTYTTND